MNKKNEKTVKEVRREIAGPNMQHPGVELRLFGDLKMTFRPPVMVDPYVRLGIIIEGLSPIVGPCAPNLDTYLALLAARLRAGKLSQEAYDRLLADVRGKQVQRMESDANGDAADKIAEELVQASVNTFARDVEGHIVLQSYSFRAALRECLSESGYFMENAGTRERFKNGLGVWPLAIQILRDDAPLSDIDDVHVQQDLRIVEGDQIASQPVHVWAANKMQHSISQFEVINPPWRARLLIEIRRSLFDGFEGTQAEAEADGQGEEAAEAAKKAGADAKKLGKPAGRKVRMAPIRPEDVIQALGLLPTIAWGAKRSMGYGRARVIGVTEPQYVEPGSLYPFDWKSVRGL